MIDSSNNLIENCNYSSSIKNTILLVLTLTSLFTKAALCETIDIITGIKIAHHL